MISSMARRSEPRPELTLGFAARAASSNRTDGVFDAIKEAILTHALPSNTPLIEQHLAETFGVSKTPVREALLRLSKEGLVRLENTRGASVVELTQEEVHDIFQMRLYLEPLALEQSAALLGKAQLKALERLLLDAKKAVARGDLVALSRCNIEFHRGLYALAPNRLLVGWLDGLSDRRRLLSVQGWQRENRSQTEWEEHRSILDAVQNGDIPLAKQRLVGHIKRFSKILEPQH
jgi:DNA-binding GntR family transcriptional regulator